VAAAASAPDGVPAAAIAAASDDPAPVLAAGLADEGTAWRELALHWNVAIGEGDACTAAAQAWLMCLRPGGGGLSALRQLDRPAVVALRDGDARVVRAVLVGLTDTEVTLQAGAQRFVLTLPALARVWRGEFATFWRAPQGWRDGVDGLAQPAVRGWIDGQLDAAGIDGGPPLRERVRIFQLAQGLPPDGLAGPLTLIRLNRIAGVDEPVIEKGR
jgi:general secretion pathway protein A